MATGGFPDMIEMDATKAELLPGDLFLTTDGASHFMLNERFAVPARVQFDGSVIGDGIAYEVDLNDQPVVIHRQLTSFLDQPSVTGGGPERNRNLISGHEERVRALQEKQRHYAWMALLCFAIAAILFALSLAL